MESAGSFQVFISAASDAKMAHGSIPCNDTGRETKRMSSDGTKEKLKFVLKLHAVVLLSRLEES